MYNPEDDINLLDTDSASFNPDSDSPETKLAKLIKQKQMLDLISPKVNPSKIEDIATLTGPSLSAADFPSIKMPRNLDEEIAFFKDREENSTPIFTNVQQNQQLNNIPPGLNEQQLKDLQTSYLDPREYAAQDAAKKRSLTKKPATSEKIPELGAEKDISEIPVILPTDTYSTKLAELQDRANRMASLMDLGRVMSAASATMVGAKESAIDRPLQAMKESIEATPKQFIALKEQEKNDPTSDVSKQYRTIAAKMGFEKETANSSAADIEKMFPQLTNMFTAKEARLARLEQYKLLSKQKEEEKEKEKTQKLTDKQNEALRNYAKLADKHYSEYSTLKQAVDAIDIKKIGSSTGPSDMAAIYNFVRILDPTSVVREGELALAQAGMSYPERFRNALKKGIYGGLIDKEYRKEMAIIAKYLAQKGAEKYHARLKGQRNILKNRYNFTDEDISQYDPALLQEAEEKKAAAFEISPETQQLINARSEEENKKRLLELKQKYKR